MHNIQFWCTFFIYYIFMGWARTHSLITVPIYNPWHRSDSLWICCINVYKTEKKLPQQGYISSQSNTLVRRSIFPHIWGHLFNISLQRSVTIDQKRSIIIVWQSTNKPYQCHEEDFLPSVMHLDPAWLLLACYFRKVCSMNNSERKQQHSWQQ